MLGPEGYGLKEETIAGSDHVVIIQDHDVITGSVNVLGDHKVISSDRDKEGLSITLDRKPSSDKPICFKIEII